MIVSDNLVYIAPRFTYTELSSTNMSFLESFITLSQRYLTRKATFAGAPESSVLGTERLYFFLLSKSSSNPPLRLSDLTTLQCSGQHT